MCTLVRLEIVKLTRRKVFYLGFLALLLFCGVFLVGFYMTDFQRFFSRQRWFRDLNKAVGLDIDPLINGSLYAALAFGFMYYVMVPPIAALAGGHSIAGEAKEGTLRSVLSRPVSRLELATAKFLVALAYTSFLIFFFVCLSLLIGWVAVGKGDLLVFRGVFADAQKAPGLAIWTAEAWTAAERLLLAAFLSSAAMSIVVALSFALSALFDNPLVAIIGALSLFLISWVVGNIEFYERLRPYLFTTHMNFWKDAFQREIPWRETLRSMRSAAAYTMAFLVFGLAFFCRRDVNC